MLHLLMTGEIRLPGFGRTANLESPWFKPEDVWEFVGRLVRKFDPERVILFGSRAWGTPTPDSDVDLLVVMEFDGRPVEMAVRIGAECDDRFPVDLIVRRPAEVQRGSRWAIRSSSRSCVRALPSMSELRDDGS